MNLFPTRPNGPIASPAPQRQQLLLLGITLARQSIPHLGSNKELAIELIEATEAWIKGKETTDQIWRIDWNLRTSWLKHDLSVRQMRAAEAAQSAAGPAIRWDATDGVSDIERITWMMVGAIVIAEESPDERGPTPEAKALIHGLMERELGKEAFETLLVSMRAIPLLPGNKGMFDPWL